jgi:hypothetical protein
MKLASLKHGCDGRFVVVSDDGVGKPIFGGMNNG